MSLHEVNQGIHKHKKTMRIGRGVGSGKGKTSGKGHKGQLARAGWKGLSIFQGGGSPLVRRVPKRGFTNSFALTIANVNISEFQDLFEAGEEVSIETLQGKGLLKKRFDLLKVLGNGELTKKLNVSAHRFSEAAKEKIEKAGGTATVVPGRTPVAEKQAATRAAKKADPKNAGKKSGAKKS
ncbi:50S ribosomal protein L15 [Anatilimnocola aggregata]|uniref:Large ribosomal subunit protein uL15 n=1 Tax=Anatilimnocola aggregata TaxID=2528021 RepID=A0A517YJR2_9BACT|nr:50S ribosomal protein L15 [Anatilimnocola aggregata]QDU30459.1 50S ribosomal protein L15 [Anatilimnocola aggregata]